MTRVLSALLLVPVVVAVIWLLPAWATLALAAAVSVVAFVEYRALAMQLGAHIPTPVTVMAVLAVCTATGWPGGRVDGTLMAATIAVGATAMSSTDEGRQIVLDVSAALFAVLYLALPLGALAAIRAEAGAPALLLLLLTVMASDTAQFYGGRLLGRRALAPRISPNKTVEGAAAGFLVGTLVMVGVGRWWLPTVPVAVLALLGTSIVALGIVGDLFESAMKRGAGVKDASSLIPGHGGMLDRIDALLFAGPVFYIFVRSWR